MLNLRSSVYARGILFIAFVCMALLGLDLKQTWSARGARLREAQTDTTNLARSLAQHTKDVFDATDAFLIGIQGTIVADGTDPAAIQRLNKRMRVRVAAHQLLHGVSVFDEQGNWLATSLPTANFEKVRNLNYTDRDFFQYHRNHADDVALIGLPIQAKIDGDWIVPISRRLNNPDGSFAGVVEAAISTDLFQSFFQTFDIGEQGAITLTDGQGNILIRRPYDEINVGRSVVQSQFFQKLLPNLDVGSFEFISLLDHTARLGSFHRVPGFDLIMIVALQRYEVLATWRNETKIHLIWVGMTVLLMVILGYRLTLQIRDRIAAETVTQRLRLEAEQHRNTEAERRAYERELEQQKRELERSNSALEQFAYAASHDLQSPLRAIGHLAEWIDDDIRATASQDTLDNLKLLNGRVARLQMLTSGLLAYARLGAVDQSTEDVDVEAAVQDIVAILEPRPGFVIACDCSMSVIHTDRTPLLLVLRNLIGNAVQHHDRPTGRVDVGMRLLDDGMVEMRVTDDGPGIEKRFHDEIFVIFKTLHRRDDMESSGIGLGMVKKLVTENGGRIWVESAPPARGSAFVFTWRPAAG